MLCGPSPVREALHCGALLTVVLLWSYIEKSIALRGVYDAKKWRAVTRRSSSQYFSDGIETWLLFPSIHRVLRRSIAEVDELLKKGVDVHEKPLACFKTMRKRYLEHYVTPQSVPRRCSRREVSILPRYTQTRLTMYIQCTTQSPESLLGGVKYCSNCRLVAYCSIECQRKHWIGKHRLDCHALASASRSTFWYPQTLDTLMILMQIIVNSPSAPVSYRDRCSLLQSLRIHLRENIRSIPHKTFIVVKIGVASLELTHQSYTENAMQIEQNGRAQYGKNFDIEAFLQKAIRMRQIGEDERVFVFVVQEPYMVVDVVSVRNGLEGWVEPESRKWVVR